MRAQTEQFGDRVRRLASERGVSVEAVLHEAWDPNVPGTSTALAKKALRRDPTHPDARRPSPALIKAVARALGVPPEEFPEYRLALARRQLDEREVGLDQALRMLEQIEKAMRPRRAASRREAERSQATDPQQPADRPARRSPREG